MISTQDCLRYLPLRTAGHWHKRYINKHWKKARQGSFFVFIYITIKSVDSLTQLCIRAKHIKSLKMKKNTLNYPFSLTTKTSSSSAWPWRQRPRDPAPPPRLPPGSQGRQDTRCSPPSPCSRRRCRQASQGGGQAGVSINFKTWVFYKGWFPRLVFL